MAKTKWIEPNPKHPRGKHGRFVKRGTGAASAAADGLRGLSGVKGPASKAPKAANKPIHLGALGLLPTKKAPRPTGPAAPAKATFRGGRFGDALRQGLRPGDRADVETFMRAHTEFTHEATGMRVSVRSVQAVPRLRDDAPVPFEVTYDVRDRDGKIVGKAWRQWNSHGESIDGSPIPEHVDHLSFDLDRSVQGNGFARAWNERMEQVYRDSGIKQIRLTANEDVGGYAWAKQGYDFADEYAAQELADRIDYAVTDDFVKDWAPEHIRELRALQKRMRSGKPDDLPTPLEVSMIGWTPGVKMWPGKEFLMSYSWEGKKVL